MSIVAAATAAVQIGLAVGATTADYTMYKLSGVTSYPGSNRNLDIDEAVGGVPGGLDYFFVFGCSDDQRNSYWTVSHPLIDY